jgi:hypothetical protein
MINVLSDFMEASLLFFAVYTADAPAQLARSKMGGRETLRMVGVHCGKA